MLLKDIRPGLLVTSNTSGSPTYRIVKQMTYMLAKDGTAEKDKRGRVIEVDNSRRNKWFVKDVDNPDRPMFAACFDQVMIDDGRLVFSDAGIARIAGR